MTPTPILIYKEIAELSSTERDAFLEQIRLAGDVQSVAGHERYGGRDFFPSPVYIHQETDLDILDRIDAALEEPATLLPPQGIDRAIAFHEKNVAYCEHRQKSAQTGAIGSFAIGAVTGLVTAIADAQAAPPTDHTLPFHLACAFITVGMALCGISKNLVRDVLKFQKALEDTKKEKQHLLKEWHENLVDRCEALDYWPEHNVPKFDQGPNSI